MNKKALDPVELIRDAEFLRSKYVVNGGGWDELRRDAERLAALLEKTAGNLLVHNIKDTLGAK